MHLSHHLAAVRLHRDLRDTEVVADLFVQPTRDHQTHDISFPSAERCVARLHPPDLRQLIECRAAAVHGLPDRGQQQVSYERLWQHFERSSFHSLDRGLHIYAPTYEDDWHCRALNDEPLQIEAGQAGEAHLRQNTTG